MFHLQKSPKKAWPEEKQRRCIFTYQILYQEKSLTKFQRSSAIKMSSCYTSIRSYSPSVSRYYCYCRLVRQIKGQQKTYVWKVHRKKTCRIIITNFLLSFSIYLVSLSLYTKLVYKVLLKKHLTFVANINPMFFHHYTALKLLYTLLCNSSQS